MNVINVKFIIPIVISHNYLVHFLCIVHGYL